MRLVTKTQGLKPLEVLLEIVLAKPSSIFVEEVLGLKVQWEFSKEAMSKISFYLIPKSL